MEKQEWKWKTEMETLARCV